MAITTGDSAEVITSDADGTPGPVDALRWQDAGWAMRAVGRAARTPLAA
ncbi:MAG: hypothetical protein ACRDTD_11585 [Pseudonocardiaceae bacterium]